MHVTHYNVSCRYSAMEIVSDSDSDGSWAPSEGVPAGRRAAALARVPSLSSSMSSSGDGYSSSVESSDLDEFIMSTSQSAALSRQRKKSKLRGKPTDGLMTVVDRRRRKKKQTLSTPIGRVSQEVRDLLGQGHNSFLKRDYDTAISLLEEAIRLAPGLADPFVTLGAIYEELGDPKRSLEALLVAVHLTPGDTELWKRVAIMSQTVGNLSQAIYCFKRCVKAVSGDEAEPFLRDLANLYVQAGRFFDAASILRKLVPLATGEDAVELGTLLAKSLYNINEKPEAMQVLESLLELSKSSTVVIDANVINMLAEVYLDIREWGRCFSLLTSVLDMDHLDDPEKCPVDLVAKLALAAAPSYQRHAHICQQSCECIKATPAETHYDLYLLMADGFIANGLTDLALGLLEPALAALAPLAETDAAFAATVAGVKCRTGKCHYVNGSFETAALLLEQFVDFEKSQHRKADPDSLVMLADSWRNTGRETEAGELLLHSLNYEDLLACRTLPTATSTTQRRKWLDTLNHLLQSNPSIGDRDVDVTGEAVAGGMGLVRGKFANTFLTLLNDCELDAQRIARHRVHAEPDDGAGRAHITPAWRVRKELDLEGVEDRLGPSKFVELVVSGATVCAAAGRHTETVELIEAILYNKRKKWSQRSGSDEVAAEPALVETLEKLSYSLAIEGGLNKVSTKYLRQQVSEALLADPQDIPAVERALSIMTKLIFRPTDASRRFSLREILDQRSWLVRLACKFPMVHAICLFAGHVCVYSQNYRFATQEYMRAHRLRPEAPWPLLCLGASMLSLAMSRTTKDRQLTILKAFSVLSEYARQRKGESPAEVHYNMGRAFHQLAMWHHADREYRAALEVPHVSIELRRVVGYNLALIRQRNGQPQQATQILLANIVAE